MKMLIDRCGSPLDIFHKITGYFTGEIKKPPIISNLAVVEVLWFFLITLVYVCWV
jgi:hypothetical protein